MQADDKQKMTRKMPSTQTLLMIACAVAPHEGNGHKWLLRVGFSSTFNKWGDVEYEGKFGSLDELKAFMENEDSLKSIRKGE